MREGREREREGKDRERGRKKERRERRKEILIPVATSRFANR